MNMKKLIAALTALACCVGISGAMPSENMRNTTGM